MFRIFLSLSALLILPQMPLSAQNSAAPAPVAASRLTGLSYADIADMALASRLAVVIKIRQAARLKGLEAASTLPGRRRFLVEANVLALIRSSQSVSPRITYVIDVAPDSKGKWPKLNQGEAIVFALPVDGFPNEVRLVSPDAQIAATPDNLARVRRILLEADASGAPPKVTGIETVVHSAGSIAGEGETQIFLDTQDGRPVSLSIVRNGGGAPLWSVSLGEIVDQASGPPVRNSLAWYRLACFLPQSLPAQSLEALNPVQAVIAKEDYATVLAGLGNCPRSLKGQGL